MPADGTHDELTTDPISQLDGKALYLHEVFKALSKPGRFTKAQAEAYIAELIPETFGDFEMENG